MDLKTAKARGDYRFTLNGVEHPQVLTDLRKGSMGSLSGAAEPYIGAAVLEVGYLDIELNIFSKAQVTTRGEKARDLSPVLDYFVCGKDKQGDWVNDGYLERPVTVDWNAANWQEQLEADLFAALDAYATAKGYTYDGPNTPAGILAEQKLHQETV